MLKSEADNLMRWNGKEAPFYESYYLKLNEPTLGVALWLKFLITSGSAKKEASVHAVFFNRNMPAKNVAIKSSIQLNELIFRKSKFYLNIGGAVLENSSSMGEVSDNKNTVVWNLNWKPLDDSFRHYPLPLYFLPFPSTKVIAPYLAVSVNGAFEVNGVKYPVNSLVMNEGHLWGKNYSSRWAWANCGVFDGEREAVLELLAKPPFGLGCLRLGAKKHRFVLTKSKYSPKEWHFEGRSLKGKIKGKILSRPQDIIGVTYDDPDGSQRYCYNSKVADAVITFNGRTYISRGTTAFETVESEQIADLKIYL